MKKLTKAQLAALKESGAEIEVLKKAPPKPADAPQIPQPDSLAKLLSGTTAAQDRQALVLAGVASRMEAGQERLAEQIAAIAALIATHGSKGFTVKVNRDSRELIDTLTFIPVEVTLQ